MAEERVSIITICVHMAIINSTHGLAVFVILQDNYKTRYKLYLLTKDTIKYQDNSQTTITCVYSTMGNTGPPRKHHWRTTTLRVTIAVLTLRASYMYLN